MKIDNGILAGALYTGGTYAMLCEFHGLVWKDIISTLIWIEAVDYILKRQNCIILLDRCLTK